MTYQASAPMRRLVYAWEGEVDGLRAEVERLRAALRQAIPALLDAANRLGDMELTDLENACWDAHQAACAAVTSEQLTGIRDV